MRIRRMGDEDAIESLTLDDMDTYTMISRKIHKTDVFSLVDTYFMPYGVECDQYSILGEITEVRTDRNRVSGEEVIFMTVECNGLCLMYVLITKICTAKLRWEGALRVLCGCRDLLNFLIKYLINI